MGAGIQRSRMPLLQKYLGDLAGVDLSYGLHDGENISNFDPVTALQELVAQGYDGLNVTHPYKQRVREAVTRPLIEDHGLIGSYNTLVFRDAEILAANTDYSGFMRGYEYRFGQAAPGKVMLCGAGGVGRAIAFALAKLGASEFAIFDVAPQQAQSLCEELQKTGVAAATICAESLTDAMADADGLVNCTALGMYSHPGTAFPAAEIGPQTWAFDAVYTPLETEFLSACKTAGLHCMTGFDLWFFQGVDAFKIYSGITVDVNQDMLSTALSWLD